MMTDGSLYIGHVMHHRIRPKRHRFVYRLFTMLVDLDQLSGLDRRLRFFSVERPNLFSFYNSDHGPRDGSALRHWVEAKLATSGIEEVPARIRLLSMPRFLGYVFNPLSIYYCYDQENMLSTIIYEVKNTFGEQHAYVAPVKRKRTQSGRLHQACDKDFYVSPFIPFEANYRFSLVDPNKDLDVRILEFVDTQALLVATLRGKHRVLTDRQLLLQALSHPFLPQKVMASIHYEALKLWLKGIRIEPRRVGHS